MHPASVKEIKAGLEQLTHKELVAACLRLAKFKKENKELLSYLLFESSDEAGYVENVKMMLAEMFDGVNKTNVYYAKKTLRKIVRTAGRFIRYSDEPTTEPEICIYVAEQISSLGFDFKKSAAIENIYLSTIKKINKSIATLHEDLQYDYKRKLEYLTT